MTTTPLIPPLLLSLVLVLAPSIEARAGCPTPQCSCAGALAADVWLIETRCLPSVCGAHGIDSRMQFYRLDDGGFVSASGTDFLETIEPARTTCFFVHGNRLTASDARRVGMDFARRLSCGSEPFRFVIWSWPSDRVIGPIRDARIKASRADVEAYYLASVLAQVPPTADVSLVGWSFGARAITGGLHLLGGGEFAGNSLNRVDQPSVRPRVVLMAAAVPRGWLLPRGANGLAPLQIEQMTLLFNPRDPALKHFPIVFRPGHPEALGYQGIATGPLGPAGQRIQQYNVSGAAGRSHAMVRYTQSPTIMSLVRRHAFAAEQP